MSFRAITVVTRQAALPASISIFRPRGIGAARVRIGLSAALCSEAGWTQQQQLDVLIGEGEDAGKLRLVTMKDGPVGARLARGGGCMVDLGIVAELGTEPRPKMRCMAVHAGGGAIDITLPDPDAWAALVVDGEDDAADEIVEDDGEGGESSPDDVIVTLEPENETIEFRNKVMEITTRQARLLYVCVNAMPGVASRADVVAKIFDGHPPKYADQTLSTIASELRKILPQLGLDLETVPGEGYRLRAAAEA